jgi:NAD(P)-dependent dehydrogenase (short-subunit alcohol dehydrogenase family)
MDVRDPASIAEAAKAATAAAPALDILVHNGAMMHPSGRGENSVSRLEMAAMQDVLNTNVIGPAILTRALWSQLKSGKSAEQPGKVIAVGAGVGSVGTNKAGGWYSYRLSKTALNALMMNLAIEGKRANVMALTLYPQMVDTVFAKPYLKGNPYPELRTPDEVAVRMMEFIEGHSMADSGRFLNIWSKEDIPW